MKSLSFYEQQHLQQLLQQEGCIKYLFDQFVREVGPFLGRWADHGGDRVWVRNAPVERAIEKSLSGLHDSLLNVITDASVQAWNRGNKKADDLVEGFIKDLSISDTLRDRLFSRNADALQSLLERRDNNGLSLSDRVWNITGGMKENLEFYLSSGLSAGRPAALIGQDVRQLLHEPNRRFRRVRDKEGKLVMSRPMADYHPGRGVYRSAYKNALRLTATQTNIGYRQADHERWQKMDFVLGIEIARSPSHSGPCPICDALVGKYPKGFLFTGFHPFCICMAVPIMMDHEEFADFLLDERVPEGKIITSLPAGAEKFIRDNEEQLAKTKPYWYKDNFIETIRFASSVSRVGNTQENSFTDLLNRAKQLGIRTERFEVGRENRYSAMVKASLEKEIERIEHINQEKEAAERKLYSAVIKIEDEIRMNRTFETSVAFDKDGKIILNKRGESRSVSFTKEECERMKDAIVTHNHPFGWGYPEKSIMRIGNSFSKEDILLAVNSNMYETRVVTPNYTFVLKRPEKGWGVTIKDLSKDIAEIDRYIENENKNFIKRKILTPQQAAITHWHELCKRISEKYGWKYFKTKTR